MVTTISKMENVWNTFKEPRCTVYLPNSYMLLLSALDQGWKVKKVELVPSWDQNGFIYLVSLLRTSQEDSQLLILPDNPLVAKLLQVYGISLASTTSPALQTA